MCADSPSISPALLKHIYNEFLACKPDADIISNVFKRTFPPGQSFEIVKSKTFLSNDYKTAKNFSKEHVTQAFYHSNGQFKKYSVAHSAIYNGQSWALDMPDDIERVEKQLLTDFSFNPEALKTYRYFYD